MSIINRIGQGIGKTFCPNKIVECSKEATEKISPVALKVAKGLSHFKGPEALLPVILIESFVTSGRTYQAQKRGGANEARERFIEQGTSAVVWIFGVRIFNKIGDFIGKKLGLKDIEVDVGKDAVRDPFKNLVKDRKGLTSVFKFGKITSSVFLATGIVGFVIPKINIAITKDKLEKKKKLENDIYQKNIPDIDNFVNKNQKDVNFKGVVNADTIRTITNAFENNTTCQLISQDAGIITGRTLNARNKYEAMELFFRDSISIFFYMYSAKIILWALNKLTKNTDIHPLSAIETAGLLIKNLEKTDKKSYSPNDFKALVLNNTDEKLDILFNDNKKVVTLEEFKAYKGSALTPQMLEKAEKMAELQPELNNQKILTKMQVEDILSSKWTSDPKFLKQAIDEATNGKATNPKKYIAQGDVENERKSFDKFVETLIKSAEKQGKEIDTKFINNFVKKNIFKSSIFTGIGIFISGLMLAIVVPKWQYMITEMRTGKNEFPGVTNY